MCGSYTLISVHHDKSSFAGQEYDVLYISTCEPTYPNGETRNPTKSVCDLYVFNTAITRARSLIVSFGNPHLLMSIEKHMNLKYKSGRCWSQYMKICLLHNTFIIPNCVAKRPHKKRLREILLTTIDSLPGAETPSSLGNNLLVKESCSYIRLLPLIQNMQSFHFGVLFHQGNHREGFSVTLKSSETME